MDKATIKNYLKLWAIWIKDTDRSLRALGYPSMSIEQTAGMGRSRGRKPNPAWTIEMEINCIIDALHNDQRRIIFAAHKIPVTLRETIDMDIAISCMTRYKDSQNCYTWPTDLQDARKAIGLSRDRFNELYGHATGIIEAELKHIRRRV